MPDSKDIRVAWLFPSLRKGNYWHPIFRDFSQRFHTIVFTGLWPGFSLGLEDTFRVEVVGETKFGDYGARFTKASPRIISFLFQFRPDIIFASGFSVWTILAVLLKPLGGWRVVILYDGSSPNVDFRSSLLRSTTRKLIARVSDGFCANSRAAKDYLLQVLHVSEGKVFSYTYLVPDVKALVHSDQVSSLLEPVESVILDPQITTFLFVGELIPRKGLRQLLQACSLLKQWGIQSYRLLVVGDGEERSQLEELTRQENLSDFVTWMGWIPYGQLGAYFKSVDAFIFPTLEDVWGMVLLEAMIFGRPVLCSKWAGSSELIISGENGVLFDPHQPEELAILMKKLIQNPALLEAMGMNARKTIEPYTLEATVDNFESVVYQVLETI